MKKGLLASGLFLSLFAAQQIQAESVSASTGWKEVTQILTGTLNDRVNIVLSGAIQNPKGCTYSDFYQANDTAENKDKVFSIALMALASGKPVNIVYSTVKCSDGGRPLIQSIRIK